MFYCIGVVFSCTSTDTTLGLSHINAGVCSTDQTATVGTGQANRSTDTWPWNCHSYRSHRLFLLLLERGEPLWKRGNKWSLCSDSLSRFLSRLGLIFFLGGMDCTAYRHKTELLVADGSCQMMMMMMVLTYFLSFGPKCEHRHPLCAGVQLSLTLWWLFHVVGWLFGFSFVEVPAFPAALDCIHVLYMFLACVWECWPWDRLLEPFPGVSAPTHTFPRWLDKIGDKRT